VGKFSLSTIVHKGCSIRGQGRHSQLLLLGAQQSLSYTCTRYHLLSLIRDLHDLRSITQRHTSGILLRADRTRLSLILNKRNSSSSGHQSYFPKALESTKDSSQSIDIVLLGQVLDEQDLVRRQILVWDDSSCTSVRGLETSATRGLDRTSIGIWDACCCRALESLLFLCLLSCLLLVCE